MANLSGSGPTPPGDGGTFLFREFFHDIGRMMGCLMALALVLTP